MSDYEDLILQRQEMSELREDGSCSENCEKCEYGIPRPDGSYRCDLDMDWEVVYGNQV